MSNKQNVVLRLTVNVDVNNLKEVSFVRAALRRLNVLYAKARPKSGLSDILKEFKLRDAYEPAGKTPQLPEKTKEKPQPTQHRSNLHFIRPKEKPVVAFVVEREIEPPENTEENVIDAEVLDTP